MRLTFELVESKANCSPYLGEPHPLNGRLERNKKYEKKKGEFLPPDDLSSNIGLFLSLNSNWNIGSSSVLILPMFGLEHTYPAFLVLRPSDSKLHHQPSWIPSLWTKDLGTSQTP